MELKEQPYAPTLARRLGDVPHVSGLLRRLAHATGAADRIGEWLLKAAVQRGAHHYRREFDPSLPPDSPAISDEEIGVALCLGQHPYDLDQLRAAAQLLSSPPRGCRPPLPARHSGTLRTRVASHCRTCCPLCAGFAPVELRPPAPAAPFRPAHGRPAALEQARQPHWRDHWRWPAAHRLALPP